MGTHPIFESDFDCLTDKKMTEVSYSLNERDFTVVPKNSLPTARSIQDVGYRYADGTETWDTWRYAKTSRFPLTTTFTDSENVTWRVTLRDPNNQVSFVVPISRELNFSGDEKDRVAVDSKCRFAEITFHYQESSFWHSHGIRLKTRGYVNESDGSTDNMDYWKQALELFQQGSEPAINLLKAVGDLKK